MRKISAYAGALFLTLYGVNANAQTAAKFLSHVIVGPTTTACSTTIKGAITYDTTTNTLQYCNGTGWVRISGVQTSNQLILYSAVTTQQGRFSSGGRGGVDTFCQNNKPANLTCTQTIHALVSVGSGDTIASFPANYGVASTLPIYWYNRSSNSTSVQTATNWSNLISGTILNSYQSGTGDTNQYWTGSTSTGGDAGNNCTTWSYDQGNVNGEIGYPTSTTGSWLDGTGTAGCASTYTMICLCPEN